MEGRGGGGEWKRAQEKRWVVQLVVVMMVDKKGVQSGGGRRWSNRAVDDARMGLKASDYTRRTWARAPAGACAARAISRRTAVIEGGDGGDGSKQ